MHTEKAKKNLPHSFIYNFRKKNIASFSLLQKKKKSLFEAQEKKNSLPASFIFQKKNGPRN